MRTKSWIMPILTLMVGVSLGFFIGSNTNQKIEVSTIKTGRKDARQTSRFNSHSSETKIPTAAAGHAKLEKSRSLRNLSSRDFLRELEAITNETNSVQQLKRLGELFATTRQIDFKSSLEYIEQMKPGRFKDYAFYSLLSQWANKDMDGALNYIQTLSPQTRARALIPLTHQLAQSDPQRGLKIVQSLPMNDETASVYWSFFNAWSQFDPQTAAQTALTIPKSSFDVLSGVASSWGKIAPKDALAWAANIPDSMRKDSFINSIISAWGREDIEAAAQYVSTMSEGWNKNRIASQIATQLAGWDFQKGLNWAQSLNDTASRNQAIDGVLSKWAYTDPRAALEWAQRSIQEPKAQNSAFSKVFSSWANSDLEAVKSFAHQTSGALQQAALNGIGQRWAQKDPAAAAQWLNNFSDGIGKTEALRAVMRTWVPRNPQQAEAFIAHLRQGETRDAVTGTFARHLGQTQPQKAIQWANSITDIENRVMSLETIATYWLQKDRSSAIQWIHQSSLPQESKQRLLVN